MKTAAHRSWSGLPSFLTFASVLLGLVVSSPAQQVLPRIVGEVNSSELVVMPKSQPPLAKSAADIGRMAPETKLSGMSLAFSRSAAQEADLTALIAAQQNPASPQYHVWLTPDQFAARFGMSDADLAKAQSWLQQQGLTVDGVSRSKNRISFSGTSAQVESAFNIQLHNYRSNDGTTHFAPASDVSLPAALTPVVQAVTNLSSFRPRPHMVVKRGVQATPSPNFTSGQTGNHYLTPGDVSTIYDIKQAQNAGYTGAGQSIAIMGQSAIVLSDITNFQTAAGLSTKAPTLVLAPGSGVSTIFSGDESESDLDLEYSGATAPGATIYFVYVGNNTNYSVDNAIQYAVDEDIAPIISTSYGLCESELAAGQYSADNAVLAQAAAQGQTVIAAAGDEGSTDCYVSTSTSSPTLAVQEALSVDFPASSQYVTAMGGTEFPAADAASTNTTYWASSTGNDVVSSALSYIPEQVWNDDSSSATPAEALSAGGGGTSTLTPHPSWQTGVPGIPSSPGNRLLPDISLAASPANPGYVYCSSDTGSWQLNLGQVASCNAGFRDSSSQLLTVAGGTSFTVPIFAGMVAMINQATNSTGQGVVGPTLYALAANPTIYASAFHDITSGTNACTAGSAFCSTAGSSEYAATTGYDEASGLGSLDFYNLLTAWKAAAVPGSSSLASSLTTLTAANTAPAVSASDVVTITVAPSVSGTPAPTGTVTLTVDGTAQAPLTLSSGVATYTFSSATAGSHVIKASYSGDSTYAASIGTITLNVGGSASTSGFTLSATNISVASGASGTSTVTITPNNGYAGTITWSVTTTASNLAGCAILPNTVVSGTAPVTATMTVYTANASCPSGSLSSAGNGAMHRFAKSNGVATRGQAPTRPASPGTGTGVALAGLLVFGLWGSRSRKMRLFIALAVVSVATLSTFGCGSSSSTTNTTSQTIPAGTYTLTITGTDTSSSAQMASTTMTLTVQ